MLHPHGGVAGGDPSLEEVVDPDVLPHVVDISHKTCVDDDALSVEGDGVIRLVPVQIHKASDQLGQIIEWQHKLKKCIRRQTARLV